MKKILFYIILATFSFIPILKVNATTNTTNLDNKFTNYTLSFMSWVYDNANDYLLTQIEDYDYKFINTICAETNTTNIYSCEINVIGSNTEGRVVSRFRSSYTSGIYLQQPQDYWIRYNDLYFNINQPNNIYTDINLSNQITQITDNDIEITFSNNASNFFIFNALNSSTRTNTNYNVYYTNNTIISGGSSYDRTLTIYNENDELLTTATIGDVLPSYISLYNHLPSYLTGYEKVGLTPSDPMIIISNISKGSIYISVEDFNKCSGLFGYFDKELTSQPYSSVITDYTKTLDGLYIRQDFDLSSYIGADYVYYQKCQYIEGEDDIYKYIWLPDTSYNSNITITENNTGGLDYTYTVEENGEIIENTFSSLDNILDSNNPLFGNIFQDFSSNTFGLTSIITAPLSLITSISSSTCNDLSVPLPYINSNLTLPCMTNIYQNTFGSFFTLYQTITFGIVSYWVIVRIWNLVKDFKNPDHDEIEVLDL